MTITITAFERSPDGGKGLARDMRVRWALEEVGQPYEVRLLSFQAMKEPDHLAFHPFGQIPTFERARAIGWMFAAINTVEPPLMERVIAQIVEGKRSWAHERLPLVDARIHQRLRELSARLGDADWLDGAFSAGDLLMVTVLLRAKAGGFLNDYPNLAAYVERGEARAAFQRAFAAQLAVFKASAP